MNTANNLIKRVLAISDKQFHQDNINKIRTILRRNAFPTNIIEKLININKSNKCQSIREVPAKIYKSMTYVPQISERIQNSEIYDKDKFKLAPKTGNNLRQLFTNTKTKVDKMEKSNLVYKIRCKGDENNDCRKVYIGTTKNKLKTRIAGHRSNIKYKNNFGTQKTALATHCAESGHIPDFEKIEVMQREERTNKRYTIEMLHIIDTPQQMRMNYKTDTDNCAQAYRHIINKTKYKNKQCN